MYGGKLSFVTDAWTAPNHKPFIAVTVHLEREGKLLVLPLDIVDVPRVRTNLHECHILEWMAVTHRENIGGGICKNPERFWNIR